MRFETSRPRAHFVPHKDDNPAEQERTDCRAAVGRPPTRRTPSASTAGGPWVAPTALQRTQTAPREPASHPSGELNRIPVPKWVTDKQWIESPTRGHFEKTFDFAGFAGVDLALAAPDKRMASRKHRGKSIPHRKVTPMKNLPAKIVGSVVSTRERGATAVEYGIMVALIAAVIITVVTLLGNNLSTMFASVATKIWAPQRTSLCEALQVPARSASQFA